MARKKDKKKKAAKLDPTDPEQQERAKKRRFKRPFEFIVAIPDTSKASELVLPGGQPNKATFTLSKFKVETVGDLAKFDAMYRAGLLFPLPDLSLQVLNLILDVLGLIEEPESAGRG